MLRVFSRGLSASFGGTGTGGFGGIFGSEVAKNGLIAISNGSYRQYHDEVKLKGVFAGNLAGFLRNDKQTQLPSSCGGGGGGGDELLYQQQRHMSQQRGWWGKEGRIGWRRRRFIERSSRAKIREPNTPLIDDLWPLPHDDLDKLPNDYFGEKKEEEPDQERAAQNSVVNQINQQITDQSTGRLFAVVHINGKQFKVTPEDIIVVQHFFPPTVKDQIRLSKVLLVGGKDFTIVGKPILDPEMVRIEATVIEKTSSYVKIYFEMKKNRWRKRLFDKTPYTMLRINLIEIMAPLDQVRSDTVDFSQQEEDRRRRELHNQQNY